EGVYGLRRALVIAGSESQLISLWKVEDNATRDLMIHYYEGLAKGAGRVDSLRSAQLEMVASKERHHPFYWAPFIPSGDWRPVHGSLQITDAPKVPPVAKSPRGCGCEASSTPSS